MTLYTGIGLKGFVVSQLTSAITLSRRPLPAALMVSYVTKGGMADER